MSVDHVPGGQAVHDEAPSELNDPELQIRHESKVAPIHVEYDPAVQLMHVLAD